MESWRDLTVHWKTGPFIVYVVRTAARIEIVRNPENYCALVLSHASLSLIHMDVAERESEIFYRIGIAVRIRGNPSEIVFENFFLTDVVLKGFFSEYLNSFSQTDERFAEKLHKLRDSIYNNCISETINKNRNIGDWKLQASSAHLQYLWYEGIRRNLR